MSNYDLMPELKRMAEEDSRKWALLANFQQPTGQELFNKARDLNDKWARAPLPEVYLPFLATVYAMSAVRMDITDEQRKTLVGWATTLLTKSQALPVRQADEVLYKFSRTGGTAAFASQVERESMLDAMLRVYHRVESYWPHADSGIRTNADGKILLTNYHPTEPPLPSAAEGKKLSSLTDGKLRAECAAILLDWNRAAEQSDMDFWFGPRNINRREGLLKDITNHINRAFTMTPADLAIVQASLEKHVPNPAFRERLVLVAYKGTNPFAVQAQGEEGKAKAGTRRAKTDSKQGSVAKAAGTEGAQSASSHSPTATNSVPLATASGTSAGRSMLWLTFGGATALIVLLLWRAQARGASGGPK